MKHLGALNRIKWREVTRAEAARDGVPLGGKTWMCRLGSNGWLRVYARHEKGRGWRWWSAGTHRRHQAAGHADSRRSCATRALGALFGWGDTHLTNLWIRYGNEAVTS